jgi:hypothetical protein
MLLLLGGGGPQDLLRTTSATVATLTESVATTPDTSKTRAAGETLGTILESPSGTSSRTRFYLPSSGASPVSPAAGTWTETTGRDILRMTRSRGTTAMTNKTQAHTATAANSTFLSRTYVSDPIRAQTIPASTVKGTIRVLESAANDNLNAMRIQIRVVNSTGTTFRTPALYGPTNGTVAEFSTTLRAKRLAVGGATSSVVAQAGDRIVIDIGTTNTVSGSSLSDTISYGNDSTTDLGDNETDTGAFNPFIEIATAITFSENPVRTAEQTLGAMSDATTKIVDAVRTAFQIVGAIRAEVVNALVTPAPPTFTRNVGTGDTLAAAGFTYGQTTWGNGNYGSLGGGIFDSVVRVAGLHATSSASVSAISDTVDALRTFQRTSSAALASITEAVAKSGITELIRTVAESLSGFTYGTSQWGDGAYGAGGIGEAVARGVSSFGRAVADSVTPITETVAKVVGTVRTVAQSLGAVSEAVTRMVGVLRSTADTLGSISEAASRIFGPARTVADTVATLTETVSRGVTLFTRTVADTVGAISEAVVGITDTLGEFARTVADTLGAISEDVSRGGSSFTRSTSASLATLAETVARAVMDKARTVVDTVAAISESVSTGAAAVERVVSDALLTLTEAIDQTGGRVRTAADAVASITETVVRGAQAAVRSVADSVAAIAETLGPAAAVLIRSAGQNLGAIVESIANHPQIVGGLPPVASSALHTLARGLGYHAKPKVGTAIHNKPGGD